MAADPTLRRLTTILAADVAGYSRLTGADEEGILARIRALRAEMIDPTISANRGRIANTAGDSLLVEFASVVEAARAAVDIQRAMVVRNADFVPEKLIVFRIGVHVGDVMVESDGDLRGDGVNIAARLEGIAEPGGVCVSEQAYWQIKGRIDVAATDLGDRRLKNIAEPIRVYSLEVGVFAPAKPIVRATPKKRSASAPLAVGMVALIIATASGVWYLLGANRPGAIATGAPASVASNIAKAAEAVHLSIVVLPFKNLSGDPSQDYFADGITENLTTDLSRLRNSFVIASTTANTYKGKNLDAKAIGKELGVRYVLEGSVQRDQNRVRVNAQLIDADSGAQLWAERFEEDLADLFKLQDQVVARLANSLGDEFVKAEAEKGARSKSPDGIDLAMRGWASLSQMKAATKDETDAALALFDQALKIDPNDADALAGEAQSYTDEYANGWRNSGTDYDASILDRADRAIALDRYNARAYFAKAPYLSISRRWSEALRVADAGLAINPDSALLYVVRGGAEDGLGRFEQSKSDMQMATRLSPRDPGLGWWHEVLGDAELGLGHFDAAIEEYHEVIDAGIHHAAPYAGLAAAYALKGNMEQAKPALAEARRLEPKLAITWMLARWPNLPPLYEGLRKAGLPEE